MKPAVLVHGCLISAVSISASVGARQQRRPGPLSFDPARRDGRWLAVAMLTQEMEIWDVENRRLVERLHGHAWEVNAVAYSPDGSQLASGCQDGTIRFWDPHPPTIQNLRLELQAFRLVIPLPRFHTSKGAGL